jgi:hypothetical protein
MAEDKCEGCQDAPHGTKLTYSESCFECCRYYSDKYFPSNDKQDQLKAELAKRLKEMSDNNYQ